MKAIVATLILTFALITPTFQSLLLVSHKNKHARKLEDDEPIDPNAAVSNLDMFTNTLHSINSDLETDRGILSLAKRQAYSVLDDVIGKMSAKANTSPMDHFLSMHAGAGEEEEEEGEERRYKVRI